MKVGIVGLGRMGAGIAERLRRHDHQVVGYDRDPAVSEVAGYPDLLTALPPPRVVWLMVPAGAPTQSVIDDLSPLLAAGDILVDGGNSYYKDSVRRAAQLSEHGLQFLDVGTSGGIWGLEEGFCLMVGGPPDNFATVEPLLRALAPEQGYAHVGPAGAGHYTKMIHNGIEYGMLQSYAEGFQLLHQCNFDLDLQQVAALWNHGSVVRSWLLELAERAFSKSQDLEHLRGYVDDSGEGRWIVQEAVEQAVPLGVIAGALFSRFESRDEKAFGMRVIAALRNEFGGHAIKEA